MVTRILVVKKPEYHAGHMQRLASKIGLSDIDIRRAYFLETARPLSNVNIATLCRALADPIIEDAYSEHPGGPANECWVAYQRGIVDNESDSIVRLCAMLGIETTAAKVATVYCSSDAALSRVVHHRYFNPNIEEIHTSEPHYVSLKPAGQHVPMQTYDLRGVNDAELERLGRDGGRNLNLRQMQQIRQIQLETGADHVTDVLLEAMDARWSDHCYHTTWKALGQLLKRLIRASQATANPNIVSMFEDNAGVWDFYDGQAIALKAETHNGPSAISAYFGQLTKLGGVLRDILGAGLGADPVGVFEYTATGLPGTESPIPGRPDPTHIAVETIRAIKEYGDTFGVPMMWSQMTFHEAYRAKPFALGGCIGLIPKDKAQKGEPQAGDLLLLIGGLTGNDGIHGASASSAGASMDEAAVQIGSPLEEVKFSSAILDLRDAGCIRAITDVGGAGLNSAVGEIGDPCGVWMNTALVPLKTASLPMWRILLSESQERMILAIVPEKLQTAREILARHEVRHTVIGKFTGEGKYTVVHDPGLTEQQVVAFEQAPRSGEVGIDAPYSLLRYDPEPIPEPVGPQIVTKTVEWPELRAADYAKLMPKLLGDSEIVDQSHANSQYDSSVMGQQCYGPFFGGVPTSYWAARLIDSKPYAALFTTSFNPWLFEANPKLALRQCFLACLNKLVLAGSARKDICLCDNFYTPHLTGDWAYWLTAMVDELAGLVRACGTPVISGKDSSAGSVRTPQGIVSVPPAVFLSALGKAPDFEKLVRNEWQSPGNLLVRIGPDTASLAGTVAARLTGVAANDVDEIDVEQYLVYLNAVELARRLFRSAMPIEAGGTLGALAKCAMGSSLTAHIEIEDDLLAEHRCGAIVEIASADLAAMPAALQSRVIGAIEEGPPSLVLNGVELLTEDAVKTWRSAFEEKLR